MVVDLKTVRYGVAKLAGTPIRLPDDADMVAWAVKKWVQSGLVPIEQVDAAVYLAACRIARRR